MLWFHGALNQQIFNFERNKFFQHKAKRAKVEFHIRTKSRLSKRRQFFVFAENFQPETSHHACMAFCILNELGLIN